jgi:hypothetical protein
MFGRSGYPLAISARRLACAGAALLVLTVGIDAASGQPAPASPPGPDPRVQQTAPEQPPLGEASPPANAPAREENPGLINEIGKMFGKLPTLKGPSETIEDINARAKDAARNASDTLSRMTTSSMVSGRVACPASANGAPDCKAASDKLCQTKGFKEGKSLITDSAEACSAKVLIPGRTRKPDDCRTDTFVTRALCQ